MPYIEIPGLRLHVIDEGDHDPLVFLHGFPLSHEMWDAQRREFRNTHRVIIPDLRGFGRSTSQDDMVTMDQFADDVAALLAAMDLSQPVTLCGLSMGGYIAMAFARRYPQRLGRLILTDTKSLPDTPETAANRERMANLVLKEGPTPLIATMMPRLFGPQTNEKQPYVTDAVRNVMLANSSRAIAAAQRGMAVRPDSTPSLKDITVPTLVISGEYDAISPPDEMRTFAAEIPHSEFALIPGVGHMTPMEAPQEFNAAVRDWLQRTA
ncbi:alpha/beta fold hydrolase [bacterium]|nr:alpha/beta fold hydrolase [bacterium]